MLMKYFVLCYVASSQSPFLLTLAVYISAISLLCSWCIIELFIAVKEEHVTTKGVVLASREPFGITAGGSSVAH